MIKGISITLYEKTQTGTDDLNSPIFTETPVEVDNVLVSPASADDVVESVRLYGKSIKLNIYIPKGDTHTWTDRIVEIRGERYRTIGIPKEWIEENVPLSWNKTIGVERYV